MISAVIHIDSEHRMCHREGFSSSSLFGHISIIGETCFFPSMSSSWNFQETWSFFNKTGLANTYSLTSRGHGHVVTVTLWYRTESLLVLTVMQFMGFSWFLQNSVWVLSTRLTITTFTSSVTVQWVTRVPTLFSNYIFSFIIIKVWYDA